MLSNLGFFNYYRALIPHFAELAVPLYQLGQAAQIDWSPDLRHAVEALRHALLNAAILRLPDPDPPIVIETDLRGRRSRLKSVRRYGKVPRRILFHGPNQSGE